MQLGEQVAVARETLERALQLSYELNLELNTMNDWLNLLVTEIQKTEGTFSDDQHVEEKIGFYQVRLSLLFCILNLFLFVITNRLL